MSTNIIDLDEERRKRGLSLPKPVPVIDEDFDASAFDAPVFDHSAYWASAQDHYEKQRLLTRYFAEQSDPGDEI